MTQQLVSDVVFEAEPPAAVGQLLYDMDAPARPPAGPDDGDSASWESQEDVDLVLGLQGDMDRRSAMLADQARQLGAIRLELENYRAALRDRERTLAADRTGLHETLSDLADAVADAADDGGTFHAGMSGWVTEMDRLSEDLARERAEVGAQREALERDREAIRHSESPVDGADGLEAELVETCEDRDDLRRELGLVEEILERRGGEMEILREDLREQFQLAESVRREAMAHEQRLDDLEGAIVIRAAELTAREARLDVREAVLESAHGPSLDHIDGQDAERPVPVEPAPLRLVFDTDGDEYEHVADDAAEIARETEEMEAPPVEAWAVAVRAAACGQADASHRAVLRGGARLDDVWKRIARENTGSAEPAVASGHMEVDRIRDQLRRKRKRTWFGDRTIHLSEDFDWVQFGKSFLAMAACGGAALLAKSLF